MTSRQIEMHWHCATCAHDNRGRDLNCANCGKPRVDEEYLMPGDTSSATTVTDPALLRKATAGSNWSCHYCRSSQRRLDGSCARCGAPAAEAEQERESGTLKPTTESSPEASTDPDEPAPRLPWYRNESYRSALLIGAIALAIAALSWWLLVPHAVSVRVSAVYWRHAVAIERYSVVREEGWYPAGDALTTTNEGPRVHHYDHRRVGSHTEYYSVQVACGETCTPIPHSCSESCSSNKNGFATCRTSCTGGGQSCSTKYCSERRSRSVDDYRDFPIYQPYFSWTAWRWHHQRDVALSGTTTETRWPSSERDEHLGEGLVRGEQEREGAHSSDYRVTFTNSADSWHTSPNSEAVFHAYAVGGAWEIKVDRLGIIHEEHRR